MTRTHSELISVGMPVWNSAATVGESIEAILGQSHRNLELIISDNCSDDGTIEILEWAQSRDSRIRLIKRSTPCTVSENFRNVLEEANGRYFCWAASDDLWDSDWLERLIKHCAESGHFAFGVLRQIHSDGSEIYDHPANGRTFSWPNSKTLRAVKFSIERNNRGKANLIYSLGPTQTWQSVLSSVGNETMSTYGGELAIIGRILAQTTFDSVSGTNFYKRVSLNDQLQQQRIREAHSSQLAQLRRNAKLFVGGKKRDFLIVQQVLRPQFDATARFVLLFLYPPVFWLKSILEACRKTVKALPVLFGR